MDKDLKKYYANDFKYKKKTEAKFLQNQTLEIKYRKKSKNKIKIMLNPFTFFSSSHEPARLSQLSMAEQRLKKENTKFHHDPEKQKHITNQLDGIVDRKEEIDEELPNAVATLATKAMALPAILLSVVVTPGFLGLIFLSEFFANQLINCRPALKERLIDKIEGHLPENPLAITPTTIRKALWESTFNKKPNKVAIACSTEKFR
ncbi:MAG: hypothetical protein AAGI66_01615 [Cyanobacteria bacterium P01_H01_bin.74]